jgi:hypothetical protein
VASSPRTAGQGEEVTDKVSDDYLRGMFFFARELLTLRRREREARELLNELLPHTDALVCYASTVSEHPLNDVEKRILKWLYEGAEHE